MARTTKKTAAPLRSKLKAARQAREAKAATQQRTVPGNRAGATLTSITKDRIRMGLILDRLDKQALGELPKRGKQSMTALQQQVALRLLDKFLPNAPAPIDLTVSGSIIVEERDPRQRPPDYHRKTVKGA